MCAPGATTRFFLIRHGRVDTRWAGRIYGSLDVPLAPEGREEARAAARLIAAEPLAAVVSSRLERAVEGARLVAEGRGLVPRQVGDLGEIHRGDWGGLELARLDEATAAAWERWHEEPDRLRPPGGETLADLARRSGAALDALAAEYPGGQVAVVTHLWVLRSAVCRALGLPLRRATRLAIGTGSLTVIDHPAGPVGEAARTRLRGLCPDRLP